MSINILSVAIHFEHDTVTARQRARQIARLLGFDAQDQTRISTAVSEIARNAFNYGRGGRVEFQLEGRTAPQLFIVRITDTGSGIHDLETILEGRYHSKTGMGLGIIGARRLMDQFEIESAPGRGTTVLLKKLLPRRAPLCGPAEISKIVATLVQERPQNAFEELQHQNRELLAALEEIRTRQTELTRLNRELEDTNRGVVALYAELDEKADHLRRADELKSKFLSNMSHEFRSPLNSILALSGLLIGRSDGDLSGPQEQQVLYIRKAAQDLLELVNDLLDLAKMEAGKVEVKPLEFRIENLFAALRGMLRPLLVNQSMDLIFEDAGNLPPVYSDEGKVSQILRNFVSNALKFTEHGEIRVSAALESEGEVCFHVSDTGIGIAPENLELIFQDFSQVDHPIQKRVKGTGLGLPLSKKLAEMLGGSVNVQSELGRGSEFSLRIPLYFGAIEAAVEQMETPVPEWTPGEGGLPLLVLDDRPEMMLMYRSYLANSGFALLPATTAREAEAILERVTPVAIILDIVLRAEDSWALAARLKQDPGTRGIPILVASTIEDRNKGFHLGVDAWLMKPFERADLLRELRILTGEGATRRVLLIDDMERDRYVLKQRMRGLSLLIMEAGGGSEGLQIAAKTRPDVIFLDLTMPDLSGAEVLERLAQDPDLAAIPVIVATSRTLTPYERQRLNQNAFAILGKDQLEQTDFADLLRRAAIRKSPPSTPLESEVSVWNRS
ncbi:MAG TPA: ATP-binding protein [Bryobacteraceae bacterium]|nr:ATP-binding protein [Bryobacteraceae bacterium]